jgi:hypothetical protein
MMVVGCGPRGESDTLEGLLATAKYRYQRSMRANVGGEVKTILDQMSPKLEALASAKSGSQLPSLAEGTANDLSSVIHRASYTNRPAMAELVNQYRIMAEAGQASEQAVDAAAVKLLTSRTYQLLAAELETTKFQVES